MEAQSDVFSKHRTRSMNNSVVQMNNEDPVKKSSRYCNRVVIHTAEKNVMKLSYFILYILHRTPMYSEYKTLVFLKCRKNQVVWGLLWNYELNKECRRIVQHALTVL